MKKIEFSFQFFDSSFLRSPSFSGVKKYRFPSIQYLLEHIVFEPHIAGMPKSAFSNKISCSYYSLFSKTIKVNFFIDISIVSLLFMKEYSIEKFCTLR